MRSALGCEAPGGDVGGLWDFFARVFQDAPTVLTDRVHCLELPKQLGNVGNNTNFPHAVDL